jgi:hypothetical protein
MLKHELQRPLKKLANGLQNGQFSMGKQMKETA